MKAWALVGFDGELLDCFNCAGSARLGEGHYVINFSPLGEALTGEPVGNAFFTARPVMLQPFAIEDEDLVTMHLAGARGPSNIGVFAFKVGTNAPRDTIFFISVY